jgi:hypothetical protein
MPVLWDHRCSHPRASLGMAPMVALRRSRPFVVKPATPLSLLGATPLVPSENSLSPDRNGADLALAEGLDASAAERVFGYRQATITSLSYSRWRVRTDLARALPSRHLRLPHLQLDELRTRLRCSTHVLWLWLAIDPLTKILPALHLGPRTQNAAHIVIHSLRQLLDAFLPPTLHQ